ncbi:Beta-lactamase/transpeptidase-like protein [Fusarium austroafricanum]|uniref:Beta-lactamase/transpeptidase-like protein n=1 Tax=Fusarium austroafricanum TaxID=2364996 RepID=A0A8H4KEM5_9HYPO|nr:Beta-lactamase/transpeptidase-like protein [Fusarium austroafricanum]
MRLFKVDAICLFVFILVLLPTNIAASKRCALPNPNRSFESARPNEVELDASIVAEAIAYASTHGRISVQVFRNNCRVATGPLDPLTDDIPNNLWSSTKSVIGILTGIAHDKGLLRPDDPIGKYLPSGLGWGDAAHRAITIKHLLTQTSGMEEAIISEAGTVLIDPSVPQEALSQPLIHQPGSHFDYSQRGPDLLAYVVQRAVGQDLQQFAQRNLFDPIGIPSNSYFWLRDRTANTYGYAWLFLPPTQLAKLGLLMQNLGLWNGQRVLSQEWVRDVAKSSPRNPCYGYLFWTNAGQPCTGPNFPARQTFNRYAVPSLPQDAFFMVGFFHQTNFMIPSLGITVTWTGILGDKEANLGALLSAAPADLYHNFFRILMRGVKDVDIPDPGPLHDPINFEVNPTDFLKPSVLINDLNSNPNCNVLFCNRTVPTAGIIANLESIASAALGLLGGLL